MDTSKAGDGIRGSLGRVLAEVAAERAAQDALWGVQEFPDGTGAAWRKRAEQARRERAQAASSGEVTWRHALTEEFYEALAEEDPQRLRTELIQVAAVAVQWVQSLDRRHGVMPHHPPQRGGRTEKLVRDRIPEIIESAGGRPQTRIADDGEYRALLRAKLYEEAGEYASGQDPAELADVLEVVRALAAAHGIDAAELERMRAAKAAERGAFTGRVVLCGPERTVPHEELRTRHAVRALLLDGNGDLVLLRRTKPGRRPYWSTPGGEIEPQDADPEAALRRELDEELGATVGPVRQVFAYTEQTLGLRYLSTFYLCRLTGMDLSRRHGPEFDDPSKGVYEVDRVPCSAEAVAAIDLFPAPLAAYLRAHAEELPGLLPA
ncbi:MULTISPECIES: NUDIX domain-containing protein [Thermomonospora]|mgnify:FL=1|uniref:NUDIX hydrolase n=1 Tax=Thermomonospora curvata (strain ATCC 19995 / DSM 43183 / JCM 3096 / KCTC 9072 / NBRC 15933 / NCIMB 10081 / Henssen B9) TaxID=471852 RepID=D1ADL5_THECD|nr:MULTISPECIES: NUDIX domain-containing protein [Thermomonospora]ACY97475.1 NUDIX hydrolase [Thermomonospora curvata DSM 43183]